jgi:hypothetical protein
MAKPIEGIKPLRAKDAAWLVDYLKKTPPDPKKAKRAKQDREFVEKYVKPFRR